MQSGRFLAAGLCGLFFTALTMGAAYGAQAPAAQETPQQRVAMIKAWMKASQEQLRNYQWIETTTVAVAGEQKSQVQKRCYYGVDGKLEKVVENQTPDGDAAEHGILFGRIAARIKEHKKEEMQAYLQNAVALVHQYIPPTPDMIQQSAASGHESVQMLDPGRKVGVNFADYLKAGDQLGFTIELPTNRLLGVSVSSYIDNPDDPVTMDTTMSVLPDGTIYAEKSVLQASSENLTVTVENAGYQRVAE